MGDGGAQGEKGGDEVGVDHPPDIGRVDLPGRLHRPQYAGVDDQRANRTGSRHRLRRRAVEPRGVGDIDSKGQRGSRRDRVEVPGHRQEPVATQSRKQRPADPVGASGDDRHSPP